MLRLAKKYMTRHGTLARKRLLSTGFELPSHARVVIIGGGVIGNSVAYHLSKLGVTDVVLVERAMLSSGTTWHAAGLIGQLRDTETETKLSGVYGRQLLQNLEAETGLSTGFKPCGSLTLAASKDRVTQLKIRAAKAKSFGIEGHIMSPKEALDMYPYIDISDLHAALWLPGDGTAISSDLTQALAAGARSRGVKIIERCKVVGISTENVGNTTSKRVASVSTTKGTIACDIIVNCAGLWSRAVGKLCGVAVPLASAEHFYIYSRPFSPQVPSTLPVLRDPDAYIYYREWSGGLLMGGFEPRAKPAFEQTVPDEFEFALLPEDWDQFGILMRGALHRTPCLGDAQVKMINGPESFTPDNQYILGEAPNLKNFFVAAGFNSSGIASSGGAGKALAEWIVNGEPTMDLWSVDIRRFSGCHNNKTFLNNRVAETLGLHYQITWPRRELESSRMVRTSPLYLVHKELGAFFGSKFGWERVNYFDSTLKGTADYKLNYSYGRQLWFDQVGWEHQACRDSVALFDVTSFSKLYLQGPHALSVLQRLCVNNIDVPIGKLVYTSMCNTKGGMETDLTVSRLDADKFLLITATAQCTRDSQWIQSHIDSEKEVAILTDMTSSFAMLALMGPRSRELLSCISSSDLSNSAFPFATSKNIDVGISNITAHRITYVGELGYELLIPVECALQVYETLHQASRQMKIPLANAGYYAIESLRLEKGYRAWGHDIGPNVTPFEAGLGFTVALDKKLDFIGKEALQNQKLNGVTQRVVCVRFSDPEVYAYGGEPIFRNKVLVGYLTSASFGYTLERFVGLGLIRGTNDEPNVTPSFVNSGSYEVQIMHSLQPVTVSLKPFYDPTNAKLLL